ncbi:MAG TPA: hypothetical protein VLG16_05100 [Candidatus Saccharimonadales bacterium]|nr:hypothetical protein [Candidatus Saccharimonadales bacterium]
MNQLGLRHKHERTREHRFHGASSSVILVDNLSRSALALTLLAVGFI